MLSGDVGYALSMVYTHYPMDLKAQAGLALGLTSLASLASAFGVMRLAHPKTRPTFDAVFATAYTASLVVWTVVAGKTVPAAARASPATIKMFSVACMASLTGLWASVCVQSLSTTYDKLVLGVKQRNIVHQGWPWATLPSCITHVGVGLVLGLVAIVGASLVVRIPIAIET